MDASHCTGRVKQHTEAAVDVAQDLLFGTLFKLSAATSGVC